MINSHFHALKGTEFVKQLVDREAKRSSVSGMTNTNRSNRNKQAGMTGATLI